MARKALLTDIQCSKIRDLKSEGARAVDLAKQFGVSESSLYKVLDGSYKARPAQVERRRQPLPVVPADKPMGITPSLFANSAKSLNQEVHPAVKQMLEKAQHIDEVELDDLTVAAAELVVAKVRLNRALAHTH